MAKKIIEVSDLVKKYKKADTNALDSVSFSVSRGEFFALLGPNGAGKTTTISILNTTLNKSSGKVMVAGHDLDSSPSDVRKSVGVIFQKPSLDENLTAEENVRFHAVLYGLYPFAPFYSLMSKDYKKKLGELGDVLGISDKMNKPIKTFSGGMKRKLEIIRSLIHNPKVLFLDEPTSGLDPVSRKSLWKYLSEVRKREKMTIFLTTHYLEEAEEVDHVVVIDKGKVAIDGTPRSMKDKLVQRYLVMEAENSEKLIKELKKLRLEYSGEERIRVELNGKSAQKVIQKIKTPLSYLDIHNPTLEEAYLDLIANNNHASN